MIWAASSRVRAALGEKAAAETVSALQAQVAALAAAAGNCRIAAGSYTGAGQAGADHPNTLTFPFPPKLVVLAVGDAHSVLLSPNAQAAGYYEAYNRYGMLKLTWSGNSLSWYVKGYYNGSLHGGEGGDAEQQLNKAGTAYFYLALG